MRSLLFKQQFPLSGIKKFFFVTMALNYPAKYFQSQSHFLPFSSSLFLSLLSFSVWCVLHVPKGACKATEEVKKKTKKQITAVKDWTVWATPHLLIKERRRKYGYLIDLDLKNEKVTAVWKACGPDPCRTGSMQDDAVYAEFKGISKDECRRYGCAYQNNYSLFAA